MPVADRSEVRASGSSPPSPGCAPVSCERILVRGSVSSSWDWTVSCPGCGAPERRRVRSWASDNCGFWADGCVERSTSSGSGVLAPVILLGFEAGEGARGGESA